MTQMLEKPAPSAAVAMPRNRVRVSAAPPAHENTGSCSPNRIPTGAVACRGRERVRPCDAAGAVRTTAGSSTMSNSRAEGVALRGEVAHLPCRSTIRDDLAARAVAEATLRRGGRERDSHARDVVPVCECDPCGPSLGLESERVDHRRQTPPQPLGDDRVEQRERVGAGREVLFAFAHHRPQVIARHDLLGREVPLRPR